ncbi:hypothetical protein F5Y14DRAFT_67484 [Nemania sp. NC0429]|nr:hypothetical protein F5Y14DRAFT_67484 [Nemania sp. NC0429]
MSRTFDQFVRFTTDAAGLERILRLLQSITQILTSYPFLLESLLILLAAFTTTTNPTTTHDAPNVAQTSLILLSLRAKLNLARRYFRIFRFLESFSAAQKLYTSLHTSQSKPHSQSKSQSPARRPSPRAAVWLDVLGRTFNGMYLLLEASTIVDAQRVDGLAPWGPEAEAALAVEGQRFWLFSLVCGVLAGLVRVVDIWGSVPASAPASAPASGDRDGNGQGSEVEIADADKLPENTDHTGAAAAGDGGSKEQQIDYAVWRREARARISGLGRRVVSDALDITLPGSVVGWVPAGAGTVGLAMFVTTLLTSVDIWERCGRELDAGQK